MTKTKIAIFHNFMDNIGGAEIVTLTMAREFKADIYTTNIDKKMIIDMGFEDIADNIYSIGKIPKNAPFRHQSAFSKFRKLNLAQRNEYAFFIIAGDWAMSGAVHNQPNLWYAHSPLNELWAFKTYIRNERLPAWKRPLYDIWVAVMRKLTLAYSHDVDTIVCNSENTKKRVGIYYGRDATVLNPPIYTGDYHWQPPQGYWLSVNRLIPHKRIEMQMKTFSQLPNEKLVIVGSYEKGANQFEAYKEMLKGIQPPNVEIRSWVDRETLLQLYAGCKGVLTTAKDEDFGMTAVEAMAAGKPVIAPNEGGYKETVQNGVTGLLIDDVDADKLKEAILEVNKQLTDGGLWYKDKCQAAAKSHDTEAFIERLTAIIRKSGVEI